MKKIVASVGLVALGASGIQTASAQALAAPDNSKPWSLSASLRGFYDDNVSTYPNDSKVPAGEHRDSFGFEISPWAALNWSLETTTISVSYLYSLKYYENKPIYSTSHNDQTHTFNASLSHRFNDQIQGRVSDSFVIGQEPDLLRAGNTMSTFQRISGDNIRNYGAVSVDAQLTHLFGLSVGYDNTYYDYTANQVTQDAFGSYVASLAGLLNRMENGAHVEGLWQVMPETKALVGYAFRQINYTSDQFIGGNPYLPNVLGAPARSDARNDREHKVYVGAEHNFTPDFSGALRVGASYTDYFNDSNADASYTPYVNGTLRYLYAPESYVEGGFEYDRNSSDVAGFVSNGQFTLDAESAVVFASINHRIVPQLYGSLLAQFQNSTYNGGGANGQSDRDYLIGLNLEYRFTPTLAANIGYNYDNLQSDLPNRAYDRNRVYIGVTASY